MFVMCKENLISVYISNYTHNIEYLLSFLYLLSPSKLKVTQVECSICSSLERVKHSSEHEYFAQTHETSEPSRHSRGPRVLVVQL